MRQRNALFIAHLLLCKFCSSMDGANPAMESFVPLENPKPGETPFSWQGEKMIRVLNFVPKGFSRVEFCRYVSWNHGSQKTEYHADQYGIRDPTE